MCREVECISSSYSSILILIHFPPPSLLPFSSSLTLPPSPPYLSLLLNSLSSPLIPPSPLSPLSSFLFPPQGRASENDPDESPTQLGVGRSAYQVGRSQKHFVVELLTPFSRTLKNKKSKKNKRNASQNPTNGTSAGTDAVSPESNGKEGAENQNPYVRYVRLIIHRPATDWGSSIWRLQLWGVEMGEELEQEERRR